MFSVILKIQAFFELFKQNKGVFFTTLSILSIVGMVLSVLFLGSMSERTVSKVYGSSKATFLSSVEGKLISKGEQLLSNAELIIVSRTFLTALSENNITTLSAMIKSSADSINKFSASKYEIELFSKDLTKLASSLNENLENTKIVERTSLKYVSAKLQPTIGIERVKDIIYQRGIIPILNQNRELLGILEVRQDLDFLYQQLNDEKKSFIFLEDKDFFDKNDLKAYRYTELNDRYVSFQSNIDHKLFEELKLVDMNQLKKKSFAVGNNYFITYRIIEDIEGSAFGMLVVAEDMRASDSLVTAANSIANNSAIAALALVVSLLILMI